MTIIKDMSNEDYHAHPAVGSSGIKLILQSPLHFWDRYQNPNRERSEPTPAMKIGTAWHMAFFEPELFAQQYIEVPEGLDRRTKEGKELFAHIEASGKEAIKAEELARLNAMSAMANKNPISKTLKEFSHACEQSFFVTDPDTGIAMKIRPDLYVQPCKTLPYGAIVDGKTCEDASNGTDGFARNIMNNDMPLQAAYYCDAYMLEFQTEKPPLFVWLAQERNSPYACQYFKASAAMIEYGRRQYRQALKTLLECQRTGIYPGYPEKIQDVELPAWAQKIIDGE